MVALAAALLLALPAPAASKAPVAVKISWLYEGVPGLMTVRAPKAGTWETWKTGTAADAEGTPAGAELPDQAVAVRPGEAVRAVLLYRNPSDKTVRFFAAPHNASPASATLGFKFKCLCTNHVYTVAPGAWWYRVVELRVAKGYVGENLEIRHQLVAVDEGRAEEFGGDK